MSAKLRNILMCCLTAVTIVCLLTVSLTYGRYEQAVDSGSDISSDISFNVSNKVEVSTVEELFIAIENGYSYVKVADEMENPLVVSSAIVNVGSDLILDLNGHDLQRNNRDAMLNVAPNVNVTVIDSSTNHSGSLYNPVGNVLKVGGGTLTVAAGTFESGPRPTEYLSYTPAEGEFPVRGEPVYESDGKVQTITCDMQVKGDAGYTKRSSVNVPVITPSTALSGLGNNLYYANGNLYIDELPGADSVAPNTEYGLLGEGDGLFKEDTFLYYSIEDAVLFPSKIHSIGSANFFYSYYVRKTVDASGKPTYSGAYPTKEEATVKDDNGKVLQEGIAVTVYGYTRVIDIAINDGYNFAAIKMEAGSLQVSGGNYVSYFGVPTAYCVYASGGKMSVEDGNFSSIREGVCVRCNFQSDDSTLVVNNGNFKAYQGDIIEMTSGRMSITGGTFAKDATAYSEGASEINHNNSAIDVTQGTIDLQAATKEHVKFYLAGYYMVAIKCGAGASINSKGVDFQFGSKLIEKEVDGVTEQEIVNVVGGNNIGIYGQGGNVNVEDCVFIQPGDNSYGIYSMESTEVGAGAKADAKVTVRSSIFSLRGIGGIGIYAEGGNIDIGTVDDMTKYKTEEIVVNKGDDTEHTTTGISIENYTLFYLDHVANCYGIYVTGEGSENTAVNVYSGQFFVGSGKSADGKFYSDEHPDGIPADVGGVTMTAEDLNKNEQVWSAGVYLNKDNATVGLGRVRMIIAGDYAAGVFAERGKVTKLAGDDVSSKDPIDVSDPNADIEKKKLTAPTTVLFIGTQGADYYNGGYNNDNIHLDQSTLKKNEKWIYLYKFDYDYWQTANFEAHYDRISTCRSTNNYGIAAKGGNVTIGRAYINLRSEFSRGLFASSSGSTGEIILENYIADIADTGATQTIKVDGNEVNVPVQLSTTVMTIRNGDVQIYDADIRTDGIGILLNRGKLTFKGESGGPVNNVEIDSVNTSSIFITSTIMATGLTDASTTNDWIIEEKSEVTVNCNLTPKLETNDKNELAFVETEPIPWKLNSGQEIISHNGINIMGGSLFSYGELKVNFTGLCNKDQTEYDPYNMSLTSCAINVQKLYETDEPKVEVWHTHVKSYIGGGISVKGGSVLLGTRGALTPAQEAIKNAKHSADKDDNGLVTMETFGNERYYGDANGNPLGQDKGYTNWSYYPSKTGGPAIKVADGSIEVRYGTCSAAQGNGILVSNGTATVYDGKFKGNNTDWNSSDPTGSGLASYYGLMIRGGGTFTAYGGEFVGFNGGAFVHGSATNVATAEILGGTYKAISGTDRTTNGFSVGYNATVTIGKKTPSAGDIAPEIIGHACGIAIENNAGLMLTNGNTVSVTVQGGSVVEGQRTGNANAIWYGNTSAELKIGKCILKLVIRAGNAIISDSGKQWSQVLMDGLHAYAEITDGSTGTTDKPIYLYVDEGWSVTTTDYNIYYIQESAPSYFPPKETA